MIQNKDLRIGNIISIKRNYQIEFNEVIGISDDNVSITSLLDGGNFPRMELDLLQPIPLSPEILEKCGFEKDRYGFGFSNSNFSLYWTEKRPERFLPCWKENVSSDINLRYLHQLQNCFYVLTGEELTIKL